MKFALVGQRSFALAVYNSLCHDCHEPVAVWAPENDKLHDVGDRRGIYSPDEFHFANRLKGDAADVIINAHGHAFINAAIREAAQYGAIGYHPSLLPRHRGRDAIQWTIAAGDRITGGTVYQLDGGWDTGLIIMQDWCFVDPADDASSLWREKLFSMGVQLLTQTLREASWGPERWPSTPGYPQDERYATYEPHYEEKVRS